MSAGAHLEVKLVIVVLARFAATAAAFLRRGRAHAYLCMLGRARATCLLVLLGEEANLPLK